MKSYSYTSGNTFPDYESFSIFISKVEGDFIPPLLSRIDLLEYYEKLRHAAKFIVCKRQDEIAGLIFFYDNNKTTQKGFVTFLAVDKAHRGHGIATQLLTQAENEAAKSGMRSIGIDTNNSKARDLYLRCGFSIGVTSPLPDSNLTRYYLEKELTAPPMNILLTSAGRRTYLINYFKKALAGKGLVHASNSVMTYTLTQADRHVLTPGIYDDGYIDFLLTYCQREQITAIISLFDIDLPVLAANRARFDEAGVRLVLSDERVTGICNDKWKTYDFLQTHGFDQAASYLSLEEAEAALLSGEISYPLILKPRWGMGSIGIYQAETQEELRVFYKKIKRDIFQSYLRFESQANKDACVMIQKKIKGEEYGLDVLNDLSGHYVTTIAKKKLAMRAGETDIAEIVDSAPFEPIGKKLSEALGHIANLDVDCFLAPSGKIYVLELNCRFGGQYPFSHNAGVDFPKQILDWLEGKATDAAFITPRIGTKSAKELTPVVISE